MFSLRSVFHVTRLKKMLIGFVCSLIFFLSPFMVIGKGEMDQITIDNNTNKDVYVCFKRLDIGPSVHPEERLLPRRTKQSFTYEKGKLVSICYGEVRRDIPSIQKGRTYKVSVVTGLESTCCTIL